MTKQQLLALAESVAKIVGDSDRPVDMGTVCAVLSDDACRVELVHLLEAANAGEPTAAAMARLASAVDGAARARILANGPDFPPLFTREG